MKKTETKSAAAKTTVKKTTAAAKETAKKETAKKPAAAKKPSAKKPAAKKTAAPKAAAESKRPEVSITLQYGELSIDHATIIQNVANFLKYDRDLAEADQKNVEIYVKPEEGRAYVVVSGVEEGSIQL